MSLMTPAQLHELLTLAISLAVEAPPQFKTHAYYTSVRIDTILQLRGKLDEIGVDWRNVMRTYRRKSNHKTPIDKEIHSKAEIAVRSKARRDWREREAAEAAQRAQAAQTPHALPIGAPGSCQTISGAPTCRDYPRCPCGDRVTP
jgi:hypothetical protein